MTQARDGSGQLFVVEQPGTIRIIEQGALKKVPDYRRNGRFVVNYNRREDGATVVAEYTRQSGSSHGEVFGPSESINRKTPDVPPVLVKTGLRISSFGEDEAGESM